MTSSKLNYASLRSNQRKNKSMHEVKDLLSKNAFQQPHIHHNQSPPFSLEQHIRTQKDLLEQAKFSQSLFEEVSTAEKSAHNPTKSVFGKPKDDHLYQHDSKGHHRVKSHFMETYQKELNKAEDLDRNLGSATFGRLHGNETRELYQKKEPVYVNRDADDLIEKLMEEHRLAREKEKSMKERKEGYGSRINGVMEFKSGRALGDFLQKDGGFAKETMTPDDMRPKQKDLNVNNFEYQTINTQERKSGTKTSTIKSPDQTLEDMASPKGNFQANLNNYIDYFRKTENGERRHSKPGNENQQPHHHHHHQTNERVTHHLEEGGGERKHSTTKHQIEELNMKMNEVMKINKKLLKEFAGMIQREENQAQRILILEQEFGSLKKKNRRYREELKHTVHLLEKEKIENQNNLLALKRVLSNGINMALDHRANKKHFEGTRDRERDKEKHLRFEGTLKNSTLDMSYKKKDKDEFKERKSSEKRPSNRKEESIYAPKSSLFSNDGSGYAGRKTSKEEEYDEEEEEGDKLETSEIDNEELYDQIMHKDELVDRYKKHDVWSPDRKMMTKENLKEQKIKEIQEKIAEMMMGDQEASKKHEQHQQDKLINQMKHSSMRYTGKFGHDSYGYEQKYPKVQNFFP